MRGLHVPRGIQPGIEDKRDGLKRLGDADMLLEVLFGDRCNEPVPAAGGLPRSQEWRLEVVARISEVASRRRHGSVIGGRFRRLDGRDRIFGLGRDWSAGAGNWQRARGSQ